MRDVTFTYDLPSDASEAQCAGQSIEITLSVDMQLGIGGDTWPAAELFCHLLLSPSWHSFFQNLFHQKTVIELGSGHGLAGILVDKVFNVQSVVITDLQNYVDLIDKNIQRNSCQHSRAEAMDWTVYNSATADFSREEKFDIVLALECVYRRELFIPLIRTLEAKSHSDGHKNTVIILGITRDFANEQFFSLLVENGYKFRKVPQGAFHLTDTQRQRFDVSHIGILLVYKSDVF